MTIVATRSGAGGPRCCRPWRAVWLSIAAVFFAAGAAEVAAGQAQAATTGRSLFCSQVLVIDSRGSGETGLSAPGGRFAQELRKLVGPGKIAIIPNPYHAVGVFPSLNEIEQSVFSGKAKLGAIEKLFNGLGADPRLARFKKVGAYNDSVKGGEQWLDSEIKSREHACPKRRLILTGYSQGAQVAGDVFSGLSASVRGGILGVVLFGDPLYRNTSYAVQQKLGKDGVIGTRKEFPHGPTRVLSYCHGNDPICQSYLEGIHLLGGHHYEKTGEPEKAAAIFAKLINAQPVAPPPGAGAGGGSGCDESSPPLVDVRWEYRNTPGVYYSFGFGVSMYRPVSSDQSESHVWALATGTLELKMWSSSAGSECDSWHASGTFVTMTGSSPAGTGQLSYGLTGSFVASGGDTWTVGPFNPHPPTQGDLGHGGATCDVGNGHAVCPPDGGSYGPMWDVAFYFDHPIVGDRQFTGAPSAGAASFVASNGTTMTVHWSSTSSPQVTGDIVG